MTNVVIPEGYQTVMPYIIVMNANGFLQFMKDVFGADIKMLVPAEDNTIRHGEVRIGDSTIMFAQGNEQWPPMTAGLYIHVANADETYNKALQAGAEKVTDLADMDYGRSGGVKDPYGNVWWITSVQQQG